MLHRDGTRAAPPIAPWGLQGYVYSAYPRTAALAERAWSGVLVAAELRQEAAVLKERFELDFWM